MIFAAGIIGIIVCINITHDKRVIDEGLLLMGKELDDDGTLHVSTKLDTDLSNAKLFNQYGEIEHCILSGSDKIDCMYWEAYNKCSNDDLEEIVNQLCKIYGKYAFGRYTYEDIKAYKWEDKDDEICIYCGLTPRERIKIYWVDKSDY